MLSRPASPHPPRWAWPVLVVIGIIWLVFTIYWFHVWQDHVRDLMGVPRLKWYNYPQAGLIGVVVLFLFVEIGQLVGKLVRFLVRLLNRYAPPRVSAVVVVALLLSLTIAILNGVVVRGGGMSFLNSTFASVNDEMDPDNPAPTTPLRSGGPGSLVPWDTIGHQGRTFVAGGPTVEQLTAFNGAPAVEPIRAYAGKNSADGIKAVAALAARELERTGGFKRKVIAVATTTGTGWINEAEASALEYMYNGDTAIVSMQYSFLPSWLSFLVDKENARQAGQALFEAVDARLREMPEAQRPKIVVFGESLGSFGAEAPFLSPNNIIARTDGGFVLRPDVQQHDVGRRHGQPRRRLSDVAADLRRGPEHPVRRAPGQSGPPPRQTVGLSARGLPTARVGSHHLVEPESAVRRTGLASGGPRIRRIAGYVLDSDRDVPAGVR